MDLLIERLRHPRSGIVLVTAVVSLLMGTHWPPMVAPGLVVLTLAVVRPQLAARPIVWWLMAGLWLAAFVLVQDRMEDHVHLFTAWLVALAVSLSTGRDESFVDRAAAQARVLVGVTFAVAVAWKVYFGHYVSGAALWTFMIIDDRFAPLARAVGLSEADLADGRAGLRSVLDGSQSTFTLDASDTVVWRIAAAGMGTLVLEAVIALVHLAPDSSRLAALRLPSLALFGVMTYAVVPVIPFAALLGLLALVVARWRWGVMWVFPLMVIVSISRFLVLRA